MRTQQKDFWCSEVLPETVLLRWGHHILLHKMVACAGKLSSVLRLLLVIPGRHCFPDIKILIPGSMAQSFPCVCCYASAQFRTIASSGMENFGEWDSRNDWHECYMWRGRRDVIISMAVILAGKCDHFPGVKDNMEADERGAPDGLFREAWKNNSRVNLSVFWPVKIHAGREKLKSTLSLHGCLKMLRMSVWYYIHVFN